MIARSLPWSQVVAVLSLASAPTVLAVVRGADRLEGAVLVWLLVASGVASYAYDEPARAVLDATSTTLAGRVLVRLVLVVGAGALSGVAVGLLTGLDLVAIRGVRAQLPAAAAVLALSFAAAAVSRRRGSPRVSLGDVACGPLAVLVISGLARRYSWMPTVIDDRHTARWWLPTAVAVPIAVWSTRDPYRR